MLNLIKNLTATQWIILMMATAGFLNASTAQLTEWFGAKMAHDIISVLGFVQGLVGCWTMALTGQSAQIKSVLAMPGVDKITVNSQANTTLAQIAVDPAASKIAATPEAKATVEAVAKAG